MFFWWGMGQLLCRWALSQSPPLALYVGVDVGALSLVSISWQGSSQQKGTCLPLTIRRLDSWLFRWKNIFTQKLRGRFSVSIFSCPFFFLTNESIPDSFLAFFLMAIYLRNPGDQVRHGMVQHTLVHEFCAPLHAVVAWSTFQLESRSAVQTALKQSAARGTDVWKKEQTPWPLDTQIRLVGSRRSDCVQYVLASLCRW